jgi:ribosomal protein L13
MSQMPIDGMQVDADNLYREESITDLKVASIRRMIPIKKDGSEDPSRKTIYTGQAHIMSQMGPVPVSSEIDADSLEEALQKFPEAIKEGIERMMEEAKEMQRQEASRIVVPKGAPPNLTGGGGAPGGNIILGS